MQVKDGRLKDDSKGQGKICLQYLFPNQLYQMFLVPKALVSVGNDEEQGKLLFILFLFCFIFIYVTPLLILPQSLESNRLVGLDLYLSFSLLVLIHPKFVYILDSSEMLNWILSYCIMYSELYNDFLPYWCFKTTFRSNENLLSLIKMSYFMHQFNGLHNLTYNSG